MLSAAVAVSAMAGINGVKKATMPKHMVQASKMMRPVQMDYTIQQTHQFNLQTMFKAPNRAASDLITEQPAGQARLFTRTGTCLYRDGSRFYYDNQQGEATIVYDPDGVTVWMLNPVSRFEAGTWVKGTINGDKIIVPVGQFVSWNESENYGLVIAWGSFQNGQGFTLHSDVTEVTFTVSGNTISMDNGVDDGELASIKTGMCLIWSDDSTFGYYMDINTVLTGEGVAYDVPTNLNVVPAATTANVTWEDNAAGGWNLRYRPVVDMTGAPAYWDWNDADLNAISFSDWDVIDLDDDGNEWEPALWTQDEETGVYDAGWISYSYDNDTGESYSPDNWLISPIVPLRGVVRFTVYGHPSYPETFCVMVANEDAEYTSDFVSISGDIQTQGNAGHVYEFDLSEYEGTNGMIAFRHYNCSGQFFMFISDVFVGPADAPIVKPAEWTVIEGLTSPEYTITGLEPESHYETAVMGVDENGKSAWTESVDFWTTPLIPDLFILGEVNEQGWAPNAGTLMEYNAEDNLYTATVTFDGRGQSGENYFSFTTKLAEDNDQGGWDYIAPFRWGAVTDGGDFWYDDSYDGQPLDIQPGQIAFRIMAGEYNMTVDLANKKLIIEKVAQGMLGDVNKDGEINIGDITTLISHVLSKDFAEAPQFSPANADVNHDGDWTIGDVTVLISRVLKGTW